MWYELLLILPRSATDVIRGIPDSFDLDTNTLTQAEHKKAMIEALEKLDNCICFFPEWVYNGDGGVSSVFYGFEMGQHCMINWIQHNLMFDSGKPADTRIPNGVTGWIKSVCEIK